MIRDLRFFIMLFIDGFSLPCSQKPSTPLLNANQKSSNYRTAFQHSMATSSSSRNSSSAPGTPQNETRQPIATAAGELVKCREDGELDWETLGKVITASVMGEVLCLSYADFKYGRMAREHDVAIDWKFAFEEKGVIVLKKVATSANSVPNKTICFAGRGVLNFPLDQVSSILANSENLANWDKFLVENKVLKVLSEREQGSKYLQYAVHENKKCLIRTRRDLCVFVSNTYTDDGKFIQSGLSIDHPCCPPVKGIVRAKICLGSGWHLEPYEGNPEKTLATYIANLDLCSPLPHSLVSSVMQTQPLTIYYLKKFLKSLNKVTRGLASHSRRISSRSSRIDSDLETSLTSTIRYTDSFLSAGSQRSTLYREQMAVDHFMGANKAQRPDTLIEEDEYSSTQSSVCTRSTPQSVT